MDFFWQNELWTVYTCEFFFVEDQNLAIVHKLILYPSFPNTFDYDGFIIVLLYVPNPVNLFVSMVYFGFEFL